MKRRKINPRSLENLTMHEGRPTIHGEKKTTHNISVTPTAWEEVRDIAIKLGCSGVSDLIEQLGRHNVRLERNTEDNASVSLLEVKNELGELKGIFQDTCSHLMHEIAVRSSVHNLAEHAKEIRS